jgi:hypothetical protein
MYIIFLKDPDFRHYINKQELELQTHAREALTHTADRRVGYQETYANYSCCLEQSLGN